MSHHSLLPLFAKNMSHKSHLVFLNTAISYMLDLIDPFGSYHELPFKPRDHLLHIILHDGLILLHHGICPYLLSNSLLIGGRLCINDVSHLIYVS